MLLSETYTGHILKFVDLKFSIAGLRDVSLSYIQVIYVTLRTHTHLTGNYTRISIIHATATFVDVARTIRD